MIYKPLAYIIEDIVAKVALSFSCFYDFGTTNEVVNRLTAKTESDTHFDKKYPLIWFVIGNSVEEEVNPRAAVRRSATDVSIIICTETLAEYTSRERYANNFIPILRPLYDAFLHELSFNKEVKSKNGFVHSYYENLFWGRNGLYGNEGNIFNDRLDAIIIDKLELLVIESC